MITAIEPLLREQLIDRRQKLESAASAFHRPAELTRLLQEVDAAEGTLLARSQITSAMTRSSRNDCYTLLDLSLGELKTFAHGRAPFDDLTLMAIQRE